MRYLKLIAFLFISVSICKAEVPITNLPSFTGSQVGNTDVIPFVNQGSNTTGQLQISQLFQVPSLSNPVFSGAMTVGSLATPTGTFSAVINSPSGVFTNISLENTPTSSYTNCGTITNAKGCIPIIIDGVAQKIPYF